MTAVDSFFRSSQIDSDSLAALPRSAGVYIFQGEGQFPLYIGKSVDIRSRVMSHLRTPEEARMIAQTRRIDFIETAGEIGALLLEARLIKEQSPLFNQRLRRSRSLFSIRLNPSPAGLIPEVIDCRSLKLGSMPGLYGLFKSSHAAKTKLKDLAQQHMLCLASLGLEKTSTRGCFSLQLKKCLGACVGQEERVVHDDRLLSALLDMHIETWPYSGPVDLIEEADGWVQRHRVDNWCYLGTHCSKKGELSLLNDFKPMDFDLDSYKILVRPMMLGAIKIEAVAPAA